MKKLIAKFDGLSQWKRLGLVAIVILPLLILRFQQWYWWHWSKMIEVHTVIESYDKGGNNEIERD